MITDFTFVRSALPEILSDANKYTAGSLVGFAGSKGMAGAAVLLGRAAYRSGAGLVRLVVPESIYPICAQCLLEAVYTLADTCDKLSLEPILSKCGAVAFGCGMGISEGSLAVLKKLITENTKPLLIDADGINMLSQHIDVLKSKSCPVVLTPHEGEMSRLTNLSSEFIRNNRQKVAVEFAAEYGVTLLLKGKDTVIASPQGYVKVNPTGNSGLATAGSGDVLSGIITAFLCQGAEPFKAAATGAYIHGLSGDLAAEDLGSRSVTASDIIEYLPKAFKKC